jgi:hypothetical protein
MTNFVEKDVQALESISKESIITAEHAGNVGVILNRYFNEHDRNQTFQKVEKLISQRFSDIIVHFDLDNGTQFASAFYLFCYTLTNIETGYTRVQNSIYTHIAIPFQSWVKDKGTMVEALMSAVPEGDDYVFICRRAEVNGAYAPGKSVYTYAEALLARGESVWIIALWSSDEKFIELKKRYNKLRISVLFTSSLEVNLISIIEILKLAEPKVILTETEFELPSILGILNSKIPMIYLAQGFHNLPWYDLIGINDNLDPAHTGRSKKDFFDLPVWVARDILAPEVDLNAINQTKIELGIDKNDFIIGAFARMEKFTEPFLNFICRCLDTEKSLKVILAGPNDTQLVEEKLKQFSNEGRAIVLPFVDVNIVGHCIDLGIDTFPLHSGYSVLELMAKNIPVLAKKDKFLGSLISDRLPDALKATEDDLIALITDLANNPKLLDTFKLKTNEFMILHDKSEKFLKVLDDSIKRVQQNLRNDKFSHSE